MTDSILPPAERPRYDEQLSVLVSTDTRAFLLGTAVIEAKRDGHPVREAEVTRRALQRTIDAARAQLGDEEFDRILDVGRAELAARRTVDPGAPNQA